jgi:hypothetical protein
MAGIREEHVRFSIEARAVLARAIRSLPRVDSGSSRSATNSAVWFKDHDVACHQSGTYWPLL